MIKPVGFDKNGCPLYHYRVYTSANSGPVFATMDEAASFCDEYRRRTGIFLTMVRTAAKATHTVKPQYRIGYGI